jgi:hypothetical protein
MPPALRHRLPRVIERLPRSTPTWAGTAILGLTTALLLHAAFGVMFSVFMFYDDEGYVLTSYRAFIEHGGLYEKVYTQYGPFPFALYQLLNLAGFPLTHTAGRLLTLAIWAGAALGCAMLVGKATRNLALQLAVLAAAFVYLWILASEPSHPGGLIVALTVGLAAAGFHWVTENRIRAWAIGVGVVTALLILTKINIGAFVACAAIAWWALHHTDSRVVRPARWLLPLAAIILPLGLMRPLLGVPWVQTFAAVFACSAIAVLATIARTAAPRTGWADAGAAVAAGLGTALVVLGVVMVRGTALSDLLDGILFAPLRHPVSFSLRYLWPAGIMAVAVLSLALALAARVWHRRDPLRVDTVIAGLRLVAVGALAWNLARYPVVSPDYLTFGWALPCLWLFLWPLSAENASQLPARAWLGLLLLGQCLHVFPVPGSQIAWGTLLALPLAAMSSWEAATWLARRRPPSHSAPTLAEPAARLTAKRRDLRAGALAGMIGLIGFAGAMTWKFTGIAARYQDDQDLRLPGAESLRLPAPFTATLRTLVVNASAHADVLFSFPGMFSFNLWSGVPTPTLTNVTHWFSLLTEAQQNEIMRALEAQPRAVVIVHREHIRFLTTRNLTPRGPLRDYIDQHFEVAFTVDDYEFRVRSGRNITPFMLGEILTRASDTAATTETVPAPSSLLQLPVLLPSESVISSVEIVSGEGAASLVFRLDATNTRVEVTPLTIRGAAAGAPAARTWPFAIEQPSLLSLYYDSGGARAPFPGAVLVLRDVDGDIITTGRLQP